MEETDLPKLDRMLLSNEKPFQAPVSLGCFCNSKGMIEQKTQK